MIVEKSMLAELGESHPKTNIAHLKTGQVRQLIPTEVQMSRDLFWVTIPILVQKVVGSNLNNKFFKKVSYTLAFKNNLL